jgi:glycosyltransferase involved in cell wall biosynthesis
VTELAAERAAVNPGSPRVSVCIPTYNSSVFVAETIESVLAQDYPSFELVIADHGSTDSTPEILLRYADDPRVRLVLGAPGGGAEANWNRATDLARGEYVKLVCADDPLYADCLSRQASVLDENPDVVLVASQRDIIDARGRIVLHNRGLGGLRGRVATREVVRRMVSSGTNIFGEPSSVLIRGTALRASGPWSDALPYLIDADMYVRVLKHGDFFAMPESFATFRLSATSWSLSLARQQARQNRAFQREVRAAFPQDVRTADVVMGGLRAEAHAWARRLAYVLLRRRLSSAGRA